VYDLDISADGDLLVTANLEGNGIDLWNPNREHLRRIDAGTAITRVSLHPEGKLAAVGRRTTTPSYIIDLQSGDKLKQVDAEQIRYSPAGDVYVGITSGRLRMWEVDSHKEVSVECPVGVDRPVFSPDGRRLALQSDKTTFVVIDVKRRKVLFEADAHESLLADFAFAPDGNTLASVGSDARIALWDITTGRLKAELTGHTAGIHAVAFDSAGTTLATAGTDGTIRLWRAPRTSDEPPANGAGSASEMNETRRDTRQRNTVATNLFMKVDQQ
jgi:WD40 repeat protein